MDNELRDLGHQKDSLLKEIAELKVQLKIMEESRDAFRHELIEANRRNREGQSGCLLSDILSSFTAH